MRIFRHYEDVPDDCKGAAAAIGNFDGVHLGHRALVARTKTLAQQLGVPLGAVAFEPHPQEFFHPEAETFRLTPFRTKARLLAEEGVEAMYALAFDSAMAKKTAEQFVRDVLVKGIGVRAVVVGADFRFGNGRAGDAALLSRLGGEFGFQVEIFEPVRAQDGAKISSSEIRAALKAGRPEEAAKLLGRFWAVEARVERGDGRGRQIGFPTANVRLDDYLKPAFGVYAVRTTVLENDKPAGGYLGVANLGIRPMFETADPLLETYLFDFSGDLYGRHLSVEIVAYIRPEMKFGSLDTLQTQITTDCRRAREKLQGLVQPD